MVRSLSVGEKRSVVRRYEDCPQEHLLDILLDLQGVCPGRCIDADTARWVAGELGITETRVFEALSFYSMLHMEKQAHFVFEVCGSTPCFYSGGRENNSCHGEMGEILRRELGVGEGQITADGLFAWRSVPCFGACAQGPALSLNDIVYGNLTEERIRDLIRDCRLRSGEADRP